MMEEAKDCKCGQVLIPDGRDLCTHCYQVKYLYELAESLGYEVKEVKRCACKASNKPCTAKPVTGISAYCADCDYMIDYDHFHDDGGKVYATVGDVVRKTTTSLTPKYDE